MRFKKNYKLPENIKLIDGTEKFSSYTLSNISEAVIVYAQTYLNYLFWTKCNNL